MILRYETARSSIDMVFGPKVSKEFPRKYLESDSCGPGFWKSTGRGKYKHPGVDLEATHDEKVCTAFQCFFFTTITKRLISMHRMPQFFEFVLLYHNML